ncbi:hypothetical protein ANN_16411 [Periplaneta americana]|uniref:Uncharacterized protein n=1 Tax=Periplaneta americana TaxID=6978 RepID=A0ABQ8SK56_PERAM|nr:hypothetical protein ANN_16411 [Periplaneta americana]
MSPGSSTESYPAFARIGLRENPGKTSTSTEPVTSLETPDKQTIQSAQFHSSPASVVYAGDSSSNPDKAKRFSWDTPVSPASIAPPEAHKKSEQEMPEALKLVEEMTKRINETPSTPVTERVKQKWKSILCKNNGYGTLCNINSKLVDIESPENKGLSLRDCNDVRTHFDIGCHARIPTRNTILRWVASFRITGSTLKKKSPGRNSIALRLSEATVRSRALRLLSLGPFEGPAVIAQLEEIQDHLKDSLVSGVVDEITDACGHHVANFLVGKQREDEAEKPAIEPIGPIIWHQRPTPNWSHMTALQRRLGPVQNPITKIVRK